MKRRLLIVCVLAALSLVLLAWQPGAQRRDGQSVQTGEPKGLKEVFRPSDVLPADKAVTFPSDI